MAHDWIRMRTWIAKDPKVIAMSNHIAENRMFIDWLCDYSHSECSHTAHEFVSPSVTRSVTVTALLQVWGVTREQGRKENDDLVVDMMTVSAIDEIAEVPGIGEAMEFVGWVEQRDETTLVFPKFFTDNAPIADRDRWLAAQRQKKHREKRNALSRYSNGDSNVTSNVTVTDKEKDSIVYKKKSNTSSADADGSPLVYQSYPRKVGRQAALRAIAKAIQVVADRGIEDPAAWLVEKVQAFAKSPAGNAGEFVPHPSTWFNEGRYDDDPAEWSKVGQGKPEPVIVKRPVPTGPWTAQCEKDYQAIKALHPSWTDERICQEWPLCGRRRPTDAA